MQSVTISIAHLGWAVAAVVFGWSYSGVKSVSEVKPIFKYESSLIAPDSEPARCDNDLRQLLACQSSINELQLKHSSLLWASFAPGLGWLLALVLACCWCSGALAHPIPLVAVPRHRDHRCRQLRGLPECSVLLCLLRSRGKLFWERSLEGESSSGCRRCLP